MEEQRVPDTGPPTAHREADTPEAQAVGPEHDALQEPAGWAVPAPKEALEEAEAPVAEAPGAPASASDTPATEPAAPVAEAPGALGAASDDLGAEPAAVAESEAAAGEAIEAAGAAPAPVEEAEAPDATGPLAAPGVADVRAALRLRRALDAQLDRVVQLGRELVNARLFSASNQAVELREAQLRSAVAVANETESVEVLRNWLYYQVARPDGRGWRQNGFAEGLVAQLDNELDRLATTAANGAGAPECQRDAHLRLTRLYLGFLSRHFAYRLQERERAAPGAPAQPSAPGRPAARAQRTSTGRPQQPGTGGRPATPAVTPSTPPPGGERAPAETAAAPAEATSAAAADLPTADTQPEQTRAPEPAADQVAPAGDVPDGVQESVAETREVPSEGSGEPPGHGPQASAEATDPPSPSAHDNGAGPPERSGGGAS